MSGLRGHNADNKMMMGLGQGAATAVNAREVNKAAKGDALIGTYSWLFSKSGIDAVAGTVTGNALGLVVGKLWNTYLIGELLGIKDSTMGTVLGLGGDVVAAAIAFEVGKMYNDNFAAFAAIGAATRGINKIIEGSVVEPLALKVGIDGLDAWAEYGYEGGGVGDYDDDMGQIRLPEEAAFGQVRIPEEESLYGMEGLDNELYAEEGTLFG